MIGNVDVLYKDWPMTNDEGKKALEKAALALYEQGFDSVQVLATWVEGGYTHYVNSGAGNFYARRAMCQQFVESDVAQDAANKIAEALDKPDDGDAWKEAT